MLSVFLGIHALLSVVLIGLILIRRGKGADIGAAFGSGASQTVFGAQGAASFLTRTTAILATLFFISCLWLAHLYGQRVVHKSVTELGAPPVTAPADATVNEGANQPSDVPALPVEKAPAEGAPAKIDQSAGAGGGQ